MTDAAANPLLDRQIERLDALADLGMEMARALTAQAKGTGPRVVEGDVALAYDRVARAVRMAMMLQSRLTEDASLSRQEAAELGAEAAADAARQAKARKDSVARVVGRVAQAHGGLEPRHIDWLARQARERLEHDDIYGQVMSQPVSDLVAAICRDLGLTPQWARLAEEAWAREEIAAGPGQALAGLATAEGPPPAPADAEPGEPLPPPPIMTAAQFRRLARGVASDPSVLAIARGGSG